MRLSRALKKEHRAWAKTQHESHSFRAHADFEVLRRAGHCPVCGVGVVKLGLCGQCRLEIAAVKRRLRVARNRQGSSG